MTNAHQETTVSHGNAVHWFNPENDLALASGLSNYTPPKAGLMVRQAGEALPLWYGNGCDTAICTPDEEWLKKVTDDFGLTTSIHQNQHLQVAMRPQPWGWSAYTVRQFEGMGFSDNSLPSAEMIERMRLLSHRRTASQLAQRLKEELADIRLADPAVECRTADEVMEFLKKCPDAYLKSPWSGSGRGVISTSALTKERVIKFASDSIRLQGSVMAERAYDKTIDFAMLFECHGGLTYPSGTSVFLTDSGGAYTGNLLASEETRFSIAGHHAGISNLERVRERLISIINEKIAPFYEGVLGVDMLAATDGTLDAAVELNLRTTMGYVANKFADKYMPAESCGVMRSRTVKGCAIERMDYTAEGGKLVNGMLHLSPPCGGFLFSAEIKSRR